MRLLVLLVLLPVQAEAQARPFVFSVTTTTAGSAEDWTAHYDVGFAEHTADPFGYEGLEQRVGIQGSLGAGFTLLGHLGLGVGQTTGTSSTQEAEVLKDIVVYPSGLRLAAGLGMRREWQGETTLLGRVSLGRATRRFLLFGNLRLERPFAEGRDELDLITSLGWLHRVGSSVHLGVEALGEDLEGFWEEEEAEGGAKLFVGPSVRWARSGGRLYASLCGGPIFYATRSDRSSLAPRPLGAGGNGFTVRLSLGLAF